MFIRLLKSKIHRAAVTQTDLDYPGSVTIDADLLAACGMLPNEAVTIADCENGNRFETYIIRGEKGSGIIGVNGAAARLTNIGNRLIIMSFVLIEPALANTHNSRVILVDHKNRLEKTLVHPTAL
jgi:aspartate 1-decarboxylase